MTEKRWLVFEEFDVNYLSIFFNEQSWHRKKAHVYWGKVFPEFLCEFVEGICRGYVQKSKWISAGKSAFSLLKEDKKLIWFLKKESIKVGNEMSSLLANFNKKGFDELGNAKLNSLFWKVYDLVNEIDDCGFVLVAVDAHNNFLSNKLNEILEKKFSERKFSKKLAYYLNILTTPVDLLESNKENLDLIELALGFRKKSLNKEQLEKKLFEHWKNYCLINYVYYGPVVSLDFFREELNDLLQSKDLEALLEEKKSSKSKIEKQQTTSVKDLALTADEKYFFDLAREIVFLKAYRKETLILSYYLVSELVKVVSKNSNFPFTALRHLTPKEFSDVLLGKKFTSLVELNQRRKYSVVIASENNWKVLLGEKAKKFLYARIELPKLIEKEVTIITGTIASPGLVKGTVKIVNKIEEIYKIEKGDILVSYQTNPELMPAIKKASAIVTDLGGLTCHAAIVSRELNIPCVIGTTNGTKLLKDGDLIEVDASHGVIRIIERVKKYNPENRK
ncbi:MAG: PEP-utilizing enzyme [Candidatus Diapherotrites archaeon]|nr:PEP-utilizing enzyme [Candidatus Diapherotrites archaeon]